MRPLFGCGSHFIGVDGYTVDVVNWSATTTTLNTAAKLRNDTSFMEKKANDHEQISVYVIEPLILIREVILGE